MTPAEFEAQYGPLLEELHRDTQLAQQGTREQWETIYDRWSKAREHHAWLNVEPLLMVGIQRGWA